ncbi:aldehyde dehydrogenase family protein [Vibrio ishigakensis]|uniref:aldehyde dehydrogenase family protein n=1 Tax=Vibrio ishigakensis TaxID=1481914 RepID=UPI0021C42FA9|nr:aldehyde dehydrogenase family protein [Vibrio ishigakensis]
MQKIAKIHNPFDLSEIGEVPFTDWDTVEEFLAEAYHLYRHRAHWQPKHKRITILGNIARIMQEEFEQLAMLIASEGGKPLIDARIEVDRAIAGVQLCISELQSERGVEIPMDLTAAGAGRTAFTSREPIGVVVAVSAFNHPLNLIVHQVAPAIAVGCPVIVKPAMDTPLSCQRFVEIAYEAGLDDSWCRMVYLENEVASKLITDQRVAFLTFIGSARVGWMLRSQLAPGTRCALEHGGAAPVIMAEDADLNSALPALMKGGFYHSGQVCVSVQRVFAPKKYARELAQLMAYEANKLVVGDAREEATQCGPLIRPAEVTRVAQWVDEAVQEGAEVLSGGKALSDTTYAPTILFEPSQQSKVSQKEIFGPVVCVYTYDDIDQAIELANSLDVAFQASVFTENQAIAQHCIKHLDATAVMVNDHTAFRVDWMPFAGRHTSGYGTGGIGYTMHDMTQDKMAVFKHG